MQGDAPPSRHDEVGPVGLADRRVGPPCRGRHPARPGRRTGSCHDHECLLAELRSTRRPGTSACDASAAHGSAATPVVGEGDPPGADPAAEELDVGRGSAVLRGKVHPHGAPRPARRSPSGCRRRLRTELGDPRRDRRRSRGSRGTAPPTGPTRPPWGQIHAPDGGGPRLGRRRAPCGPTRSSHSIAATSNATDDEREQDLPASRLFARRVHRATGFLVAQSAASHRSVSSTTWILRRAPSLRAGSARVRPRPGSWSPTRTRRPDRPSGPLQLPLRVVLRREEDGPRQRPDRPTLRARARSGAAGPSATWRSWRGRRRRGSRDRPARSRGSRPAGARPSSDRSTKPVAGSEVHVDLAIERLARGVGEHALLGHHEADPERSQEGAAVARRTRQDLRERELEVLRPGTGEAAARCRARWRPPDR